VNGKRVAQLLASEIEGHEGRGLGSLAVVDADPDAEPSPDGTRAYAVADGEDRIAVVDIYPEYAVLTFEGRAPPETADIDVEGRQVTLPDGPSVKRVLPAFAN